MDKKISGFVEKIKITSQDYSTTRRITKQKPVIESQPEDKFETVLFLPEGEGRQGANQ